MDPGDDYVLDRIAVLDLNAEPGVSDEPCPVCGRDGEGGDGCNECNGTGWKRERGRTWDGPDADAAEDLLASVRESHVAQATGRYARNADDPDDSATVFVRTDACPDELVDYVVPDVVWTYGDKQEEIIRVLRDADEPLSATEISERADCSEQHVHETLKRVDDATDGVEALVGEGEYGATLYSESGLGNRGVARWDGEIVNSAVLEYMTWALKIRETGDYDESDETENGGDDAAAADADGWGPLRADTRPDPGG
jgi:HTH domain.